jgi:outer membrane protein insertion porin family
LTNGEASVALKQAQGTWVTSMVGYTAMFNNLDNMRDPHLGLRMDFKQDLAGVGGDSKFIRTTADVRAFHELYFDDIVGVAHFQGGNLTALGGGQLRVIDNFNLGQTLVRGFAPGGIGPRDMTNTIPGSNIGNALGGTDYFGASLEAQFPIWGLPRDVGLKGAIFADAGTLFNYTGSKDFSSYLGYGSSQCVAGGGNTAAQNIAKNQATAAANYTQAACINVGGDSIALRSSVGASLIWASPMGPIRFNYAIVTSKQNADVTQNFSFSGGTSF